MNIPGILTYLQIQYLHKKYLDIITKDKLIQVINAMPEKINIDDLIEEFVLLSKIEHGLADVETGRVFSEKQVAKKMEKWLK